MSDKNDSKEPEAKPTLDKKDTEVRDTSKESTTPPDRYDVSSYGWDSDVEGLVKRFQRGDIHVPDFQRGFVWNNSEKSRFIESLILGLPVPNVFLALDAKTKKLNIVDGQQRLQSLWDFLEGKFCLTGREIQDELRRCYFSRDVAKSKRSKVLSDSDARTLSDAILHSIVITPNLTHDDPERGHEYNQAVIQIFRRLNTSGKPLQAQEIRTSILYGPLDDLIRELNEDPAWRELFGKRHSRLRDMELILRFIALREDVSNYLSPMPKFLDRFMEQNRGILSGRAEEIGKAFKRVAALVRNTVGKDSIRSGNTLVVTRFDAVMVGLDSHLEAHPKTSGQEIATRLQKLETDEKYQWSIDEFVNDTGRVQTRIERARAILGA